MSYTAYINGQKVDISESKPIAYTKQVNDLARLDNRQSNFTHKFTLPFTANNVRIMKGLYFLGSNSNTPYQKLSFDLIDNDNGRHLIYQGWANIGQTTSKGYEINIYDGIIDFYKTIENKTLTDVGISDLNHLKNLTNIIDSWVNDLNYKYIIADYNGKNLTSDHKLNADYLIPSAKVSYLFDRIHQFSEHTYSGTIFTTEKFTNFWMTFPKPVPTTEPVTTLITSQDWALDIQQGLLPYRINTFPSPFTTAYATNVGELVNAVRILETGAYIFNCSGNLYFQNVGQVTELTYYSNDANGTLIQQGTFNPSLGEDVIVNCEAGGHLVIANYFIGFGAMITGDLHTTLSKIEGYNANFENALVDFKATDFINEILQHFGLTGYKDKYRKHIVYMTLEEVLQNPNVIDWSDKFSEKNSEKYTYSNYAKKNAYKYRYNEANESHNDGYLYIDDENLKDETTILNSKIYSPEKRKATILGRESNVYRIWDKNVKDDNTIDYRELDGRYYYLRFENHHFEVNQHIKSEVLNTSDVFTNAPVENFYRLSRQQVLYDNYRTIESLLYQARNLSANIYLKSEDVINFDFKKLVFIKQLGGYFLVNKINNFIKNTKTKVDLIEVDYFRENETPEPVEYYLTITEAIVDDCEVTFEIDTNIEQPTTVAIIAYALTPDGFGGFYYAPLVVIPNVTMNGDLVVYTFTELPPQMIGDYKFEITYTNSVFEVTESPLTDVVAVDTSCYSPPPSDLSYITITDVETINISGNVRTVRVHYVSDLSVTDMTIELRSFNVWLGNINQIYFNKPQNGYLDIGLQHIGYTPFASFYSYNIELFSLGVTSNLAQSNQ